MTKLVTVFGTRPEIIRLSAVLPKLDKVFDHITINTYQNFLPNLNDIFVDELRLRKPDYNISLNNKNLGTQLGTLMSKVYEILKKEKPDKLLVLGDTHSCLSVIPASHLGVKIYHMEAGMRSGDWRMPEEKNRRIVDHLSDINLPYTEASRRNLLAEGIDPKKIFVTGNPIIEVINNYSTHINSSKVLDKMKLQRKKFMMATIHRVENTSLEKNIKDIISGLSKISKYYRQRIVVFSHPRLLESLSKFNIKAPNNIRFRKSIGFFDFAKLEKNATCVITDSGTVPEECAYFKVPCITVRDSTERPEFVDLGSSMISGTKSDEMLTAVKICAGKTDWNWNNSLGDGKTSEKVMRILGGAL